MGIVSLYRYYNCPDEQEIIEYINSENQLDSVKFHINNCDYCKYIYKKFKKQISEINKYKSDKKLSNNILNQIDKIEKTDYKHKTIELYQIRKTKVPENFNKKVLPKLIIITEIIDSNKIRCLPISINTDSASEKDIIIKQSESELGYEYMIESWNQITISKNYVSEFVNVLNQKHIDYVQDMFNNYIENIPVGIVNEDNTDDIKKFQTLEIQNLNYLNPQFKSEKKMFDFILKKDTISLYNDKLEKIEFNFKKNVKQFAHNVKQFFSNILPKHKLCLTQLFTNTAQAFRGTEIKNIIFLKQIKDFKIILETNLKKYPYKIYITLIDNNNKKISIGNLDLYKNNEFIEGINLKYINSFDYKLDNGEYVLILNLDNSEHKINFKIENE